MDVVLYPRAAPSDRLRIWVGAFQTAHAPVLDWLVDGNPAVPDVLRPMTSARPDAMLPAGVVPGNVDRAFTGVYEFTGLQPDTVYWISLLADGPNSGYSKPERYRPPFLQTLISHSMCCWSLVSIRRRIAEDWQE